MPCPIGLAQALVPAKTWRTRVELAALLLKARALLETHQGPLSKLAGTIGLSEFHFSRLFREAFGESPGQFRARRRHERAYHLMAHEAVRIGDVALGLGWTSHASFSREFRRRYGQSPTQLRNSGITASAKSD